MVEKKPQIGPNSIIPEALRTHCEYGVAMPYSSTLDSNGNPSLSFYSAFVLHTLSHLYKEGHIKHVILCGEATFGRKNKTTSDLMKEGLLRLGVVENDIFIISAKETNLDNTPLQIRALSKFQQENHLRNKRFLVVAWEFHEKRVDNHIKGFELNATTVSAEKVQEHFVPAFNLAKLRKILPEEFEKREKWLRLLSRLDKTGLIPRLLSLVRGASVTDITKGRDGFGRLSLRLDNTTGKRKMKAKKNPFKQFTPN